MTQIIIPGRFKGREPVDTTLPIHDGSMFVWSPRSMKEMTSSYRLSSRGFSGIAFQSTLDRGLTANWYDRPWSGRPDEGFLVRSHRTGRIMLFVHFGTKMVPPECTDVAMTTWVGDRNIFIDVFND